MLSITVELHVVSWTRHFCKVKTIFIYKNLYLLYTGSLAEQEIIFHSCRHKLDRQRWVLWIVAGICSYLIFVNRVFFFYYLSGFTWFCFLSGPQRLEYLEQKDFQKRKLSKDINLKRKRCSHYNYSLSPSCSWCWHHWVCQYWGLQRLHSNLFLDSLQVLESWNASVNLMQVVLLYPTW